MITEAIVLGAIFVMSFMATCALGMAVDSIEREKKRYRGF